MDSSTPLADAAREVRRDLLARSLPHVEARLLGAVRVDDPFPHVWIDRLLPDDCYEQLAAAWPPDDVFWSARPEQRLDLVPRPAGTAPADLRAAQYDRLPDDVRAVWDFFILEINRRIVGAHLERLFAPEINERLAMLESIDEGGRLPDYLRPPYRPQMNVGRLMSRGHGYNLRPHVDALAYLVTALYYFPTDADDPDALGTTLFRPERALDVSTLLERGKTAYFHKAGIHVEPARQIPFVGNALLAFANTGRSAHGVHITTPGVWRRAFQSHLSLKGDEDHL